MERILRDSGAKVLVTAAELLSRAGELKAECPELLSVVTLVANEGDINFDQLPGLGAGQPADLFQPDENDLIALNYTSGTTGYPKGVMYTHRGAYLNALGNVVENGLSSSTRCLWTLPMFHCNGWCYLWSITAVGGVHVCLTI